MHRRDRVPAKRVMNTERAQRGSKGASESLRSRTLAWERRARVASIPIVLSIPSILCPVPSLRPLRVHHPLRGYPVSAASHPSAAPPAEKIGEHRYRIGQVTVDTAARTAQMPCRVNMQKGMIEYLAVASEGKLHESALRVDAEPLHLHLALLLLGLEPRPRPR